ncbi:MAG: hypothetical protein BMS9Abin01_2388 [Gammaproteobacteria bacterium]|nr:MAG: hypothetical protein BMS9Abin01_2388 [Gammaproteobacteria bacterium]
MELVRGLDNFRTHFADFPDRYVLIGGTACALAMDEAGLNFRATKDLDIVLLIEALDVAFVKAFWKFVEQGQYDNRQKSTGDRQYYRFYSPSDKKFPEMLELFSRRPDILEVDDNSGLTPIPVDDEVSSLSAILMDEDYYALIHAGKRDIDGLPVVGAEHLIPLKAKAWLDLLSRKERGERIDSKDVKKHKNDVFRLYQLLTTTTRIDLPTGIVSHLAEFLSRLEKDGDIDLQNLGIKSKTLDDAIEELRAIYQVA